MRHNDHDVTDKIRTTDLQQVSAEVLRLYRGLYEGTRARVGGPPSGTIERAFADIGRLYLGEHPEYLPCDTEYHDIQHVLDVTLAMARLMDGYERSRNGAEYTLTHVTRGSRHLHRYLPRIGLKRYASAGATLMHYTGYERRAETIPLENTLLRRVGHMLGTADIIAQMADRCYLEKCRDRLYPEFVLGGLTKKKLPGGGIQLLFTSGDDLVRKTPGFYMNAVKRLDLQLARAYEYAERHFKGQNLYLEEMQKNVRYAQAVGDAPNTDMLRRLPPSTLQEGVEPYPQELVIR